MLKMTMKGKFPTERELRGMVEKAAKDDLAARTRRHLAGIVCQTHGTAPKVTVDLVLGNPQGRINVKCCCDELDALVAERMRSFRG